MQKNEKLEKVMTRNLVLEADPVVFITALVYAPTITGSERVVDKATKRAALHRDNKHCCRRSKNTQK